MNACRDTVGGHESGVHLHLLFRVAKFGLLVPIQSISLATRKVGGLDRMTPDEARQNDRIRTIDIYLRLLGLLPGKADREST